MKAVVYNEYGPAEVLKLANVPVPAPKADEVLIKTHAATVTSGDVNVRGFTFVPPGFGPLPRLMFGLNKPRLPILGMEIAGEVVATGKAVTGFKEGDVIFGIDSSRLGAYAEYTCRSAQGALALKPANLCGAEAAALPFGAGTALHFLRNVAKLQPGQKVLVNGASGGVGVYAVQLARHFGAEVTGVCSTRNVALVLSLGAHHVLDYTQVDFTRGSATYDVILDTVVGKNDFDRCKRALTPNGLYLAVAGGPREMRQMVWTSLTGGKQVNAGAATEKREDLLFIQQLAEAGALRPVIDRRFPLEQTADAHRYVDTGRKAGCVVITVAQE